MDERLQAPAGWQWVEAVPIANPGADYVRFGIFTITVEREIEGGDCRTRRSALRVAKGFSLTQRPASVHALHELETGAVAFIERGERGGVLRCCLAVDGHANHAELPVSVAVAEALLSAPRSPTLRESIAAELAAQTLTSKETR